jgi:thiosulfate dehydrogenase [quinone] large subunit
MQALRRYVTPLALVAALLLIWMENPWINPEDISRDVRTAATIAFWVLAIVVLVLLFQDRKSRDAEVVEVEGPAFARYLFGNTKAGLFWLPVRLFVGFEWLSSGMGKLYPAGKPVGAGWLDGGASLLAYWQNAVRIPDTGRPPISFEWYRGVLQFMIDNQFHTWFSYLIVFGELAIGVGLLVGALTGIAAFFGATLNMSFLLAGSASTNPILFTAAIGLIVAWRVAGWYGLDRYLLPLLGTPWTHKVATHPAGGGPAATPRLA